MLGARGGVHHRGGRPAERHQYLSGVDFTADPVTTEAAAAVALSRAFADSGPLIFPKGPPTTSDDGVYSPFIGINPPSLSPLRTALRQLASLDRATPEAPMPGAAAAAPAQTRGLVPAIGEETPDPPVPPPEPPVTTPDDPPPPPVIVVTPVTPVEPVTPPPPPPEPHDPPPPAPTFIAQTPVVTPPAAIPEPQTWAMLLLGFGVVGAAIRRRRDKPAAKDCC